MNAERDGFVIYNLQTGAEADFVSCTKDGRMRERVEEGLTIRVDFERFYLADTRDPVAPLAGAL